MFYTVGYHFFQNGLFTDAIIKYKSLIKEVYFSWEDIPNARCSDIRESEYSTYYIRQKKQTDLKILCENGIKLNILLNGNCYGKYSQSRSFFNKIGDSLQLLISEYNISAVTTTSPLIAKFVKENFKELKVRASVNMEIGTIQAMDYIKDLFDGFYLKRELNRDIQAITNMKQWCSINGKKLFGLANSGCLNYCSARTFHDNLVSHEDEISQMDNAYQFEGQCYTYLRNEKNQNNWLKNSNFIRPEDVYLYEELFDGIKLATRTNKNPIRIIESYCKKKYIGAIHDLLEPNHAGIFYPKIIDNHKIESSFATKVLYCNKDCLKCNFCSSVQNNATVNLETVV